MKKKRGKVPEVLEKAVDQLAVEALVVEPDDVMALGSILEQLERIDQLTQEEALKPAGALSRALRKLVEKVILAEVPEPKKALELLATGVRLIQEKIADPDANPTTQEEKAFWESLAPLVPEEKPVLWMEKETRADEPKAEATGRPQEVIADFEQDMDLCNDFITEALEHLQTIELQIINLEQSPGDKECINSIFRPFHTIKGVSGFLNLKEINHFSHAMESLLDEARTGRLQVHQEIIDFILEAVDVLKSMILELKEQVRSGRIHPPSIDLGPYLQKIDQLRKGETVSQGEEPEKNNAPPLGEILSQKGVVSPGDVQETLRIQQEEKKDQKIGEILVRENKVKPWEIVEALRDQRKAPNQPVETTVKVDTDKLDNLVDLIGELVIAQFLVAQNPAFSSLRDPKLNRDFSQYKRITVDL